MCNGVLIVCCCLQGSVDEQFQGVLQALFSLAGAALKEGGTIVTWLPFTLAWLGGSAEGAHHFSLCPHAAQLCEIPHSDVDAPMQPLHATCNVASFF